MFRLRKPLFRTLIVGTGNMSGFMVRLLAKRPRFVPVGLVGTGGLSQLAMAAGLNLGQAGHYTKLATALRRERPDVVLVNSPSPFHYGHIRTALDAGAHVLAAKPITNDFVQARRLVGLAERRGTKLAIAQQVRLNRHYRAVGRIVDSGALGLVERIDFLEAKRRPVMGNNTMRHPVLYEMSCHHFDAIASVFPDYMPEYVFCDGYRPTWSVYNGPCSVNAAIVYRHDSRPPLHLHYQASFSAIADRYVFRLEGDCGALECRADRTTSVRITYAISDKGGSFRPIEPDAHLADSEPFEPLLDQWTDYLDGGPEPFFSGRNILREFALIAAAARSADIGRRVKVQHSGG